MAPRKHSEWDEKSTMMPLLLILVGVIVLLVNLGFMSADWISYWPVILIAVGLMKFMQHN